MSEQGGYTTIPAAKSKCPECGGQPILLMATNIHRNLPAFYICECGFIGQVGVGPVQREWPHGVGAK